VALEGKIALVTGGARGIGRGTARCLLEAGAKVQVASRTVAELDESLALLSPLGEIAAKPCDVSDRAAVDALVADTVSRFGGLDILVCSHGVYTPRPFTELDDESWHRTIGVNLDGLFFCGRAAAKVMIDQGRGGRIVNVTSISGLASEPDGADYNASKGGAHALTRSMACDLGRYGITVNAVAPGWIHTPMSAPYLSEEIVSGQHVVNLAGRIGQPEDIARAVLWLVDPATSYVTGATIIVDGGQTATLPMPADIAL
jgi:NAD(P)-dependent dehydrogenase (short-subunit alcohol dehydrogenase family)